MSTAPLFSANHYQRMSFGDFGFRILEVNDTSVSGEKFGAITVLKNCTVTLTSNAAEGDAGLTDFDLDEGQTIVGNFTDVSISKGCVICYIRK